MSIFECRVLYRPNLGHSRISTSSREKAALKFYASLVARYGKLIFGSLTIEVTAPSGVARRYRLFSVVDPLPGEWT